MEKGVVLGPECPRQDRAAANAWAKKIPRRMGRGIQTRLCGSGAPERGRGRPEDGKPVGPGRKVPGRYAHAVDGGGIISPDSEDRVEMSTMSDYLLHL